MNKQGKIVLILLVSAMLLATAVPVVGAPTLSVDSLVEVTGKPGETVYKQVTTAATDTANITVTMDDTLKNYPVVVSKTDSAIYIHLVIKDDAIGMLTYKYEGTTVDQLIVIKPEMYELELAMSPSKPVAGKDVAF